MKKLDYQLCALLWQSVEPTMLAALRSFKTCKSFWKKVQEIFANDIQRLYDVAEKLTSLKQMDHDMMSFIAEGQAVLEELKVSLEVDSLEETKKKLDKFYMVMILRAMNSDFDHVRDQILSGSEVPTMESLTTCLLQIPTLKDNKSLESMESSAMAVRGRGDRGVRGGRGGRGRSQCTHCKRMRHTHETCYSSWFSQENCQYLKSQTSPSYNHG